MSARTKRYYTVKEAAKLIGVSTNTIYTYLDGGAIKAKRIGKGRFKIPDEELAAYINPIEKTGQDRIFEVIRQIDDGFDGVESGERDFVFFRIFLALTTIGLGVVFLTEKLFFLSVVLLFAGVLIGLCVPFCEKHKSLPLVTDTFSILVFGYAFFYFLTISQFDSAIFFLAAAVVLVTHQVRGFKKCCETASLAREIVIFGLIVWTIWGILILLRPSSFPITFLAPFISNYRAIFVLAWYGSVIPIMLTYLKRQGSLLGAVIFSYLGLISFLGGLGFSIEGKWDMAFSTYFFSVFSFFTLWWKAKGEVLEGKEFHFVFASFAWVAIAIILVLLGVRDSQENLKRATAETMQVRLAEVVTDINFLFEKGESEAKTALKRDNIATIIQGRDEEAAIGVAKTIYEKSTNLRRVIILDSEGKVLGTYPRNSLLQGADLSSRESVRVIKSTLQPYISSVFQSILNTQIVLGGVPVFDENNLTGIIGLAFNLEELSFRYQNLTNGGEVYAFDENNRVVLSPETEKINQLVSDEVKGLKEKELISNKQFIRVYDTAKIPRWSIYFEREVGPLIEKLAGINVLAAAFIAINSFFGLSAGLVLAKKWKK